MKVFKVKRAPHSEAFYTYELDCSLWAPFMFLQSYRELSWRSFDLMRYRRWNRSVLGDRAISFNRKLNSVSSSRATGLFATRYTSSVGISRLKLYIEAQFVLLHSNTELGYAPIYLGISGASHVNIDTYVGRAISVRQSAWPLLSSTSTS